MDLKDIKIEDPFWGHMQELVTDVVKIGRAHV